MCPGSVISNHHQERSSSYSHRFRKCETNTTFGLANQEFGYFQMLLNFEKNLESKTRNFLKNG